MFLFLESYVFILRVLCGKHIPRTQSAPNWPTTSTNIKDALGWWWKLRWVVVMCREVSTSSFLCTSRFVLMRLCWVFSFLLKVMHIGLMNRRVLCLCILWWCDRMCILEHRFICLTEVSPAGAQIVQGLIDAGAYSTWNETNGLEMVAEFTRSVGGSVTQENSMKGVRERFFYRVCLYVSLSICCGPYEHESLSISHSIL